MSPIFSILHATARPAEWKESYCKWIERAADSNSVEYVLCLDSRWGFNAGQYPEWECSRGGLNKLVWNIGRKCSVDAWNTAAAAATFGSLLILNSDDIEPPERWDEALLRAMKLCCPRLFVEEGRPPDFEAQDVAIHVRTGWCDGPQASGIQMLSSGRYERLGYALYPGYESLYADDDMLQHAYYDGVVIIATHLLFPHRHAMPGTWDEVYRHQNRPEARRIGAELLQRRQGSGFKDVI